jgi:hypothetical protein
MNMFKNSPLHGHEVAARRFARCWFGIVLLVGSAALVMSAITGNGKCLPVVLATWPTAFAVAALARKAAMISQSSRVMAFTLGVHADLCLALPWLGIALLLPLSLHAVFVLPWFQWQHHAFDEYCQAMMLCMGPTHLVLAILGYRRAQRLVNCQTARSAESVYWWTVFTSCIPFIVALAIPPLLVALTGIPIILILRHMEVIVDRERQAAALLPTAIAHELA